MSATADYQAKVRARGWVYLPQLPGNTKLGKSVAGRPGARSVNTATVRSIHELAPAGVQVEQGFAQALGAIGDAIALSDLESAEEIENFFTPIVEATGLDHGVPGAVAKLLGIPPWLLLIVLLFAGWSLLRGAGLVPPFKQL